MFLVQVCVASTVWKVWNVTAFSLSWTTIQMLYWYHILSSVVSNIKRCTWHECVGHGHKHRSDCESLNLVWSLRAPPEGWGAEQMRGPPRAKHRQDNTHIHKNNTDLKYRKPTSKITNSQQNVIHKRTNNSVDHSKYILNNPWPTSTNSGVWRHALDLNFPPIRSPVTKSFGNYPPEKNI